MFEPEAFGSAMGDLIRDAMVPVHKKLAELEQELRSAQEAAAISEASAQDLQLLLEDLIKEFELA